MKQPAKIAILCPTRGRPPRLLSFIQSIIQTRADIVNTDLWIIYDESDPELARYDQIRTDLSGVSWIQFVRLHTFTTCSQKVLHLFDTIPKVMEYYDLYVPGADDFIIRTKNWDNKLREFFKQYPDDLVVPYINGGVNREKCELPVVSKRWIEVVGKYCPSEFEHFCTDEWIGNIAERAERLVYLHDIVFEHMHPKYGKAVWDNTYHLTRNASIDAQHMTSSDRDKEHYEDTLLERIDLSCKVRDAIIIG